MNEYEKLRSRNDVSQVAIHLCRKFTELRKIISENVILASKRDQIVRYEPEGATCFYGIPPQNWIELLAKNRNGRKGYGMIVTLESLWAVGGRPAIYTRVESIDGAEWPESERYRLVNTDLSRKPEPLDWLHEREWRFRGNFDFPEDSVWWPCVKTNEDAAKIFRRFENINEIYVIEFGIIICRSGNHFLLPGTNVR